MSSRVIKKLLGVSLASIAMLALSIITSSKAEAANFQCSKSDAAYAVTINVDPSAPAWVRGCFQRITVNEGFTGAISFMYFSPETYDLSGGDRSATLKILYYYRGTAGVNFAGMCPKITSTSNSDGQTNVMSIPDAGLGFSLTCSGWLGHNSWSSASGSTTLYASKFNAGSNKTINMNYDVAFTFTNDTSNPGGAGITCKDYYGKPGESDWKSPPCINNGNSYAFVNIIKTPPTYDGTISIAKYREGTPLAQFPAVPSELNNAKVRLTHTPPGTWESSEKTSNPGAFNNIWVNPNNHESNTKGNYRAFVKVPKGWKVVRATNRGANATLNGSCGSEGDCYIGGVNVDNNGTTYVDFFFQPHIEGFLDGACPSNNPTENGDYSENGKIYGWVIDWAFDQDRNNQNKTPSDVRIRITEKNTNGDLIPSTEKNYTVAANKDRPDLPINTGNRVGRYHGFEFVVPIEYYNNDKTYDVKVFPLRNNQGVGSPPFKLGQTDMTCPDPGRVSCPKDEAGINYISGWAIDPKKIQGPSHAHIYFDSTPGNTDDPDAAYNLNNVFGSSKLEPDEITTRRNEGYIVDPNALYRFRVPIPDGLHDGGNHTVRVYMISEDGTNPPLKFVSGAYELTFGPSNPNCGTVEKWWWPWLQTQNGDVVNRGAITGQKIAKTSGEYPGARLEGNQGAASTSGKEAEFLVISMAGGGNPFCSNYNYILTNTSATTGDCKNGSGYGTLQLYDLNSDGGDKVFKSITEAFNTNGAGNPPGNSQCKPYNTQKTTPNTLDTGRGSGTCEGGTIFQLQSGDDLTSKTLISGRNTIYKDGNLKITGNIAIAEPSPFSTSNPRLSPNLAIIVNGDVYIDRSVSRIDAAIYATGKIFTCSSGSPTPFEQCNSQLVVNGMLVSKKGYDFRRTFANDSRSPAELIRLRGQSIAFPPPGMDNLFFEDFDTDVRIDTSEFQPRF